MLVSGWGQDMKHEKSLVNCEYDIAYFVLQFIPDERKIISQLVCNKSDKTLAFFLACGGGCLC
jgi:hypothetical protein